MDELERLRRSGYQTFSWWNTEVACKKVDKRLLNDEKFVLHQIEKGDEDILYKHISSGLKQRKSIGFAMIDKDARNFEILHCNLRNIKEIAGYAIERWGRNYDSIGKKLDNDKDLALIAFKNGYNVLGDYSKNDLLRKDKDFVSLYVSKFSLFNADETLKNDKNFIINLIKKYPDRINEILPFVSKELKQDEDVALIAVSYTDKGLYYFDQKFRKNDKIVLAALARNGKMINSVDYKYMRNENFVLVALKTYPELYEKVNDSIQESPKVIQFMLDNYPKYCSESNIFQYHYTKQQNLLMKNELTEIKNELTFIKDYLVSHDKNFSLERNKK